jgi:hypothetical protein
VSDIRTCDECGTVYAPRREHDRFCGAVCREAWNSERMGDLGGGASALAWSVTAMGDTAARLGQMKAADQPRAFAVIGEAVWWVTIVDATLVRHHPDVYDDVMAAQGPERRRVIEEALGGLRFVRNRMGDEADLAEFIGTGGPGEMTRYRAYLARLAGRAVGETFGCTAEFLTMAAAVSPVTGDESAQAAILGAPAAPGQ